MPLPTIDPAHYDAQLRAKLQALRADFAALALPEPEVFTSPPLHYRMRAEFRIWRQEGDLFYAMFDPEQPRTPVRMDDFPAASERINQLMPLVRTAALEDARLGRKLFQVEFLTTLDGDALVTLIYHRPLDDDWQAAAGELAERLGIGLIGRSKGQKRVVNRVHVTERLPVEGRLFEYQQVEGSFTQPNARVNCHMLGWARQVTRGLGGDLLELYCGNGNFTVALAEQFRRVLATEVSKVSVASAEHNFAANGIDNVRIARLSSEEFAQAWRGEREFRRLQDTPLDGYRFSTVLVDPPRAGVDAGTLAQMQAIDHIVYISCNPATLLRDLEALSASHRIERFAVFDQFPYTHHLECGAFLVKR